MGRPPAPAPSPEALSSLRVAMQPASHPPPRPRPPPAAATVWVWVSLAAAALASPALGMRGPHHPRSEVAQHHHYRPSPEQHTKITHDEQLLQDKEHIREDLGQWVSEEAIDQMSPEELQFHYFKIHDLDDNVKLDGLEILRAIMHTEEHEHHEDGPAPGDEQGENAVTSDASEPRGIEYFIELIDEVLREDDQDNDGYLSYAEYVVGRNQSKRKAAEMMAKPASIKELPSMQTMQTKK